MIRFTVLMSVWRGDSGAFLDCALRSVTVDQTLPPDKVVVVKDGPVNGGVDAVLRRYSEMLPGLLEVVPLEKNGGLGAALRAGMAHCDTEWIARMDADDISEPDRFAAQAAYIESNPGIDVLGGNIAEFDSDETITTGVRTVPRLAEDIARMLRDRNPMNHVTVFLRKEAAERAGGYMPMPQTEDYYLWVRMLDAGCRLENIGQTLVRVRCGNGFLQRRATGALIGGYAMIERYMRDAGRISTARMYRNLLLHRALASISPDARAAVYRTLFRRKAAGA